MKLSVAQICLTLILLSNEGLDFVSAYPSQTQNFNRLQTSSRHVRRHLAGDYLHVDTGFGRKLYARSPGKKKHLKPTSSNSSTKSSTKSNKGEASGANAFVRAGAAGLRAVKSMSNLVKDIIPGRDKGKGKVVETDNKSTHQKQAGKQTAHGHGQAGPSGHNVGSKGKPLPHPGAGKIKPHPGDGKAKPKTPSPRDSDSSIRYSSPGSPASQISSQSVPGNLRPPPRQNTGGSVSAPGSRPPSPPVAGPSNSGRQQGHMRLDSTAFGNKKPEGDSEKKKE